MMNSNLLPIELVYVELVGTDYFITLKREKQVKHMSLVNKLKMISEYGS